MDDSKAPPKKHLFTKMNYLLDLDHLHGLETIAPLGDVEKFMSDLCVLFLKGAPMRIQELDAALKKDEPKPITHASYQLRGLCSSIGAKYMVDLCQQIEQAVASKNFALCRTIGEQLKDSFLVTRDQVQAYSAQLPKKS